MIAATTASQPARDSWRYRRGEAWALGYWESITKPHRTLLLGALQRVEPFHSVVELGCGAGPCLRLIQARYPGTRCYGIDVNPQMILTAFEQADEEGWSRYLDLEHDDIVGCTVPPADVVFSSYALAYLHGSEIEAVVDKMLVSAARAVIFVEPLTRGHAPEDGAMEWAHDYARLIKAHPGWDVERWELDPPVDRLDGAILARRVHPFFTRREP